MKARGFTMLEVVLVVCLIAILSTGIVALLRGTLREHARLRLQADRLQETRRAASRIFNACAPGAEIRTDQRGLRLKDGRQLVWQDGFLRLGNRPLVQEKLSDFLVVRREGRLHLVLEFPGARYEYEQPDRGRL
jgi:prepilin-type N-terminal cleavage/methylation domain-containing protein